MPSRELLDDDNGTAADVNASLADLKFLNRYFGGIEATAHMLQRVVQTTRRSNYSMLEVAAGSGHLPLTLRSRMQARGIDLRITLLDLNATHMNGNHAAGMHRKVVANALQLPFRERTFDVVACCLFVHHLSPEETSLFVREALRCARVAVLINDLIRHPVHLGVALAGRLIYRSPITRHDAPASVRQSYTVEEMRRMLEDCAPGPVEISRHFLYRIGAIVWNEEVHVSRTV